MHQRSFRCLVHAEATVFSVGFYRRGAAKGTFRGTLLWDLAMRDCNDE